MNGPKVVEVASNKKPHRIPFYLYELSTLFHSYWSKGNEDPNYKFIKNGNIANKVTLKIFQIISIILENGMFILGVSFAKKNVMYKKIVNLFYFIFIALLFSYVIIIYFSEELSLEIKQNRANYSNNIQTKIFRDTCLKMILTM